MNLTSVDPPEVIRFVKKCYPDVELVKPKESIYNIAIRRKILPTMRVRWCCAEFKESAGAGKVTLIGIRHEESSRRAKRNEVEISSRKFSGTLDGLEEYRQEQKAKEARRKSKKDGVNIMNADQEQTLGCIHGKESLLISPIIHWTEKDVWEFLNQVVQVAHCELYDEGWRRLGCICCPMSSAKHKRMEELRWPHVKRNWIKAIKAIRNGGVFKKKHICWNIRADRRLWGGDYRKPEPKICYQQEMVAAARPVPTSSEPTTKVSSSTTRLCKASGVHRVFGKLIV